MQDLNVTLIQAGLVWEDPESNRRALGAELDELAPTDLVVLPEMFTTGFSIASTAAAESMDGPTVEWMRDQARLGEFVLTGSVKIVDGEDFYNRLIWAWPDGRIAWYDKRHLFRMAGEHERYTAGSDRVVIDYLGWRILPQVCYDLRFPVFSRNRDDYDLVIYVANWPAARRSAWNHLLPARAIENLSYCVGVNRVGHDGNDIEYAGDSVVVDYRGEYLVNLGNRASTGATTLAAAELHRFREKFPAHHDADSFELTAE